MARLVSRSGVTVLATALVVAYAAAIVAYLLSFLGPVQRGEQDTLDWRFLYRGPVGEKSQEVVLVTVDESAELPYWAPMPRDHIAGVIRSLHAGGAKLIGLDFYLGKHSFNAAADSLLREAIRRAGNVIPVSYLERGTDDKLHEILPMPYFLDVALDHGYATFFTDAGVPTTFLLTSFYWENFIFFGLGPKRGKDGVLVGVDAQQKAKSLFARSFKRKDLLKIL